MIEPISVARPRRWPSTSISSATAPPIGGGGAETRRSPSSIAVFTMITVHLALWETRLGTLPRRNSLRPAIPTLPTTTTSTFSR